ncbi:hypothetical protein ACE04B_20435, partial [Rhizobium phaseoli]
RRLKAYANVSYPSVIAVCEAPKAVAAAEPPKPAPVPASIPAPEPVEEPVGKLASFAENIAGQVRAHLPSGQDVKETLSKPVHFVSASYSWVVTRIAD